MQAPSVMFIKAAVDQIKNVPEFIAQAQLSELNSLGPTGAQQAGATGLSDDFKAGYVLGLQTARAVIVGSPQLVLKGVKPSDVL